MILSKNPYQSKTIRTKVLMLSCFMYLGLNPCIRAQTPVEANGKLKLVGKQLSSACGNPVQLRGLSTQGLQWYGGCITPSSAIQSIKNDWGADVIRLAMYTDPSVNGYLSDTAYWNAQINQLVDSVGAHGLYCIIDWHILSDNDPNTNIEGAKLFWDYMSKRHGSKKHVIYEICNEPNGSMVTWAKVKTYANTIIPIIRANDPETIIIVGTPSWSSDLASAAASSISGANAYNLMYAFHFYAATHASYQSRLKTYASKIPIFVSEWGVSESSGDGNIVTSSVVSSWTSIFNGNNTGGVKMSWCAWSFSDKNESSALLQPGSCNNNTWTNVSSAGTLIQNVINSNPSDNFVACGTALGIFQETANETKSTIYPNPVENKICLKSDYKQPIKIAICDLLGNIILEQSYPSECIFLNENWTSATYILKITYADGQNEYSKFLKL